MSNTANSLLISPQALHAALNDPDLLIIDATVELPAPCFDGDYQVRSGRDGWLQAHIPGALHADLYGALADQQASFSFALPGIAQLASGLTQLGISPQRRVVIYDRNDGFWAARLWWMLRSVGLHSQVLDGGFRAWQRAGLPEQSGALAAQPSQWLPAFVEGLWIDRAGFAGVLAGLFGVGGGIIIVPVLAMTFAAMHYFGIGLQKSRWGRWFWRWACWSMTRSSLWK